MFNENIFKQNKNLIGFIILPIIPVMIYLVDTVIAGSTLSREIIHVYRWLGFLSGDNPHNFYNFDYNRTIFALTIAISPIGVWHWFHCSDGKNCDYSGGIKGCIFVAFFPLIFLLPWLFILFFPFTLSEEPTRKQLSLYGIHHNPVIFTIFIYSSWYIGLMVSGLCLRYVCNYPRRTYE